MHTVAIMSAAKTKSQGKQRPRKVDYDDGASNEVDSDASSRSGLLKLYRQYKCQSSQKLAVELTCETDLSFLLEYML